MGRVNQTDPHSPRLQNVLQRRRRGGLKARKSSPNKPAMVAASCDWVISGTFRRSPNGAVSGPMTAIQMASEPACAAPWSRHSRPPPRGHRSVEMIRVVSSRKPGVDCSSCAEAQP